MSFYTLNLPKSQLTSSSCGICSQGFSADWTLSNLARSGANKQVKVVAHKVRDAYHAHAHPHCFERTVKTHIAERTQPKCSGCPADIGSLDKKPYRELNASFFSSVDNSPEEVAHRGRRLKFRIGDPTYWRFMGEKCKTDEVRNHIDGYVDMQDLSDAAFIAVGAKQFDSIPVLIEYGYYHGSALNQEAIDAIFLGAVQYRHKGALEAILPQGVSEEAQEKGLQIMVKKGSFSMLYSFLQHRKEQGDLFDGEALGAAVAAGAARGDYSASMIQSLLDAGTMSQRGYAEAIKAAAWSRDHEGHSRSVVRLILERGSHLSGYERIASMATAIANNRWDIAWDLTPGFL